MTAEILTLKSLEEAINKSRIIETIKQEQLVAEAVYEAVVPAMIGDFTGETIKLLEDPETGSIAGALLTGVPTAQQIIGRARWLMRVAIATVTGAKTHREAEQNPKISVKLDNKTIKLGPVELVFGTTRGGAQWKGLLSVQSEPVAQKLYLDWSANGSGVDVPNAILKARYNLCDSDFYKYNEAWIISKNKYAPGRDIVARNRFNSLLALGSRIYDVGGKKLFVPYSKDEGRLKLIGPARRDLLGFKVKISLDYSRLKLIEKDDLERSCAAIRLGILSVLAAPIILGLGKAASRGFGHFKPMSANTARTICGRPSDDNSKLVNSTELLLDTRMLLGELSRLAEAVAGGRLPLTIESRLVPVLPIDNLSDFYEEVNVPQKASDSVVLGLLGRASLKLFWKAWCQGIKFNVFSLRGKNSYNIKFIMKKLGGDLGGPYHTWPLGLPRKNGKPLKGSRTGYWLCDHKGVMSEGRRQSFLVAFTLGDDKIRVIGFPADDMRTRILPRLKHVSKHKAGSEVIMDVRVLLKETRVLDNSGKSCPSIDMRGALVDAVRFTEFLKYIFKNYIKVLGKDIKDNL